ncbi:hypothetical protein NP233_g2972 [Leucocoprinus birnbaumii]|uniref:Uncharacterized protein n=1 Tax=Leucocoprinus birnbaumii TaxID=56174 RepID=A0AAD5YYP4_9AGAR|nr:hypothetical protein NP233_g2972 [Leucocoprinus birnbaumii]
MSRLRPPSILLIPIIIIYEVLIVIGLALKPSRYRPLSIIPIAFTFYQILSLSNESSITGMPTADFMIGGIICSHASIALDGIVVTDVQRSLCRVGEQSGKITSASFAKRFIWGLDLLLSPRGVGWTHEIPGIGVKVSGTSSYSRKAFISSWLSTLQMSGAVVVVLIGMTRAAPEILISYVNGATPESLNHSLYLRVMYSLSDFVVMFTLVNAAYCAVSIGTVELGISKPVGSPRPFFGPLSSAYSLQNFWG